MKHDCPNRFLTLSRGATAPTHLIAERRQRPAPDFSLGLQHGIAPRFIRAGQGNRLGQSFYTQRFEAVFCRRFVILRRQCA